MQDLSYATMHLGKVHIPKLELPGYTTTLCCSKTTVVIVTQSAATLIKPVLTSVQTQLYSDTVSS